MSLSDRQQVSPISYLDPIQRLLARIARTPEGNSIADVVPRNVLSIGFIGVSSTS
jgi:hypothetical protein